MNQLGVFKHIRREIRGVRAILATIFPIACMLSFVRFVNFLHVKQLATKLANVFLSRGQFDIMRLVYMLMEILFRLKLFAAMVATMLLIPSQRLELAYPMFQR
jgi:hypothetical protein